MSPPYPRRVNGAHINTTDAIADRVVSLEADGETGDLDDARDALAACIEGEAPHRTPHDRVDLFHAVLADARRRAGVWPTP